MKIQNLFRILVAALIADVPVTLEAQSNKDGSMPQYLFPEFSRCEVRMKNGQIQNSLMNYNIVTERMVFFRDEKYYDLTNLNMTDTVYLNGCKFIPVGKIFYELLLAGPVDLFIQHKGDLLPAGKPVGYGGTSHVASVNYISSIQLSSGYYNLPLPSDYIVNPSPVYWIRMNNEMNSFLNEKQFLKLFPDTADEIKEFIKKNRLRIERREDLVEIVKYCSGLK